MGDSQPGEIDSLSDGAEQSSGSRQVQASTMPTAESLNSLTVVQLKERAALREIRGRIKYLLQQRQKALRTDKHCTAKAAL